MITIIDISDKLPLVPEFFLVSRFYWDADPVDLSGEEHEIVVLLGITADLSSVSAIYDSRDDCQRIADEFMLRYPGKVFGVVSSRE